MCLKSWGIFIEDENEIDIEVDKDKNIDEAQFIY